MEKVEVIEITLREDERGWVAWPMEEKDLRHTLISHVHVPHLRPGAVRGNHYHRHSTEYACVLSGPCKAVFEDNETGEHEELTVPGDKPVLFKIAPNITHAFKNEGTVDIFLLCYEKREGKRGEQDLHRKTIL
ncbi:MAG: WxcM-like domain-containing protein [Proteobacteria bacterium]|nr:WxcM-like domain-containing protein [Pseudomonadota bacterium]